MFTDMVGSSSIAEANEVLARSLVNEQREIVRACLAKFGGSEIDTAGDGFFIEFPSAVDATQCAIEIQSLLFDRNRSTSAERQLLLRIGLHLGDIGSEGADIFGSGVNLAARIEKLAPRGGICLTQQMFDQVNGRISGVKFKKQGHRELKNIAGGAVIYSVETPWMVQRKKATSLSSVKSSVRRLPIFENMNSIFSASLFALCLLCLIGSSYQAYTFTTDDVSASAARMPASTDEAPRAKRLDLSSEWMFQLAANSNQSVLGQKPQSAYWAEFDPKNSWKHAETLRGPFWLKKIFVTDLKLETPAIVLGQISGRSRVYLNGQFVGGGENSSELSFYSFDKALLNASGNNELLIAIDGKPALNPGLTVLSSVGTYLGDFREIRESVDKNQVRFVVMRNVFFAISVFIFFIALAYALFKRSSKSYFYFAFVLLLGSIELSYFNPLMNVAFDYPFLRLLRVLGLSLTPIVLFSAFLSVQPERKAIRLEAFNNLFAFAFAWSAALILLKFSTTTLTFSENFNMLIGIGIVYSLAAFSVVAFIAIKQALVKPFSRPLLITNLFYCLFQGLAIVALVSSLKRGAMMNLYSPTFRDQMVQLSLVTPFLFALAVMVIATLDYIRQSTIAQFQKRRDDFAREVLHLIHESKGPVQTSALVHEKLCKFMSATRSTLYRVDQTSEDVSLKLLSCVGRQLSTGDLSASSLKSHRILSHVLSTRTPLLLKNVRSDFRFFDLDQNKFDLPQSYRTESCMVIPLRSMGKCVGLLTFADKENQTAFTDRDFTTALELASTLALLVTYPERVATVSTLAAV